MTTRTATTVEVATVAAGTTTPITADTYSLTRGTAVLRFAPLGLPAESDVVDAQLTLTFTGLATGNDTWTVVADPAPGTITAGDVEAPTIGPALTGGHGARSVTFDVTEHLTGLAAMDGWGTGSGVKIVHNRDSPARRSVSTHLASEGHPALTVTYDGGPPEQEYRIVGPAGLETVRLVGVTDSGGLVPVRLAGVWDGTTLQPLT